MQNIVSSARMRALEQAAVAAGATGAGLMEQAGWGVAQEALRLLGTASGKPVLVLVGPGNNGGDGLVVARHLHDAGALVSLYLWQRDLSTPDPNLERCRARALLEYQAADDPSCSRLQSLLASCDLAVDALLGLSGRPAAGALATIINTLNAAACPVLAIDLPTGVDADTGQIGGVAVRADCSVLTGVFKPGVLLFPGRAAAGTLRLIEIGLSPIFLKDDQSMLLTPETARALVPPRPLDAHKFTFGRVLVLAGSPQYPGAALLACSAAARIGAGLVTLASGRSVLNSPGRPPEITLLPLPESEEGVPGAPSADLLLEPVGSCQALLIGPGLGRAHATRGLLERLLGLDTPRPRSGIGFRSEAMPPPALRPELPPLVLDADALNLLADHEQQRTPESMRAWWEVLPREHAVLTPHPGEMRRLLGVEHLDADLLRVAADAAARWGQVVVLKGATTIIAAPDGRLFVHDGANPALATAGTGDVLAGVIAGLLAQGCPPFDAATLGVFLHGAAGQFVLEDIGDAGALASDLLLRLPRALRSLKGQNGNASSTQSHNS